MNLTINFFSFLKVYMICFLLCFSVTFSREVKVDSITVYVGGLGCPFCAYGLEKNFKELKGIDDINIEIEKGEFRFTYPSEDSIKFNTIYNQTKKAGYSLLNGFIKRHDGTKDIYEK